MLIKDIVLSESYVDDLVDAVKSLLVAFMSDEVKEIPTDKFKQMLAKQGYVMSTDEVIAAVDQSGFASSVDKEKIVPKSELPADTGTEAEPTVDVGDMAGNQAMTDINAELPQ